MASPGAPVPRKRVEVDSSSIKRAKNGSSFVRCDECKRDVPVVLIDMHSCGVNAITKMNLDTVIMEGSEAKKKPIEKKSVEKKSSGQKSSSQSAEKPSKTRRLKKVKDPNEPKRPLTAFFLFMEDFRKSYKEDNPGSKGGPVVAKEGGEKWKSMSDEEKKAYTDRSLELKAEYEQAIKNRESKVVQLEDGSDKEVDEICDDDVE